MTGKGCVSFPTVMGKREHISPDALHTNSTSDLQTSSACWFRELGVCPVKCIVGNPYLFQPWLPWGPLAKG